MKCRGTVQDICAKYSITRPTLLKWADRYPPEEQANIHTATQGSSLQTHRDYQAGVRGKYAKAAAEGTNIIRLDPDVAAVFRDPKQINDILRSIARAMKKPAK